MKTARKRSPVRLVLNLTYVALVAYVAVVLLAGAWKGARAHQGERPRPAPREQVDAAARQSCLADLESLYAELRLRLEALFVSLPARQSSVEWEAWSPAWRTRLLDVSARCRLDENDVPEAAPLTAAYEGLIRLHQHYTTLSVQFSKEIGPYSDQLNAAMDNAREAIRGEAVRPAQ